MSDLVDRLRDERHCNHTYLRNEAADEIERLERERDALLNTRCSTIEALTKERDALRADAERYLVLRKAVCEAWLIKAESPEQVDAAIDAAMKEGK